MSPQAFSSSKKITQMAFVFFFWGLLLSDCLFFGKLIIFVWAALLAAYAFYI